MVSRVPHNFRTSYSPIWKSTALWLSRTSDSLWPLLEFVFLWLMTFYCRRLNSYIYFLHNLYFTVIFRIEKVSRINVPGFLLFWIALTALQFSLPACLPACLSRPVIGLSLNVLMEVTRRRRTTLIGPSGQKVVDWVSFDWNNVGLSILRGALVLHWRMGVSSLTKCLIVVGTPKSQNALLRRVRQDLKRIVASFNAWIYFFNKKRVLPYSSFIRIDSSFAIRKICISGFEGTLYCACWLRIAAEDRINSGGVGDMPWSNCCKNENEGVKDIRPPYPFNENIKQDITLTRKSETWLGLY